MKKNNIRALLKRHDGVGGCAAMAPLERRRRPGSPWIVKDMIERQHISHHYRRVVEAKSSLTASASGASRRRCGAFTSACDLERRLDQLEKQLADHLNLTSKMASGSRPSPAKLGTSCLPALINRLRL